MSHHDAYLNYALQPQLLRQLIQQLHEKSGSAGDALKALSALLNEFASSGKALRRKACAALTPKQEFILQYASQLALHIQDMFHLDEWARVCKCEFTQFYLLMAMVSSAPSDRCQPQADPWLNPLILQHRWMLKATREVLNTLRLDAETSFRWLERLFEYVMQSRMAVGFQIQLAYELARYAHEHQHNEKAIMYMHHCQRHMEQVDFNENTYGLVSPDQIGALLKSIRPERALSVSDGSLQVHRPYGPPDALRLQYNEACQAGNKQQQILSGLRGLTAGAWIDTDWQNVAQTLSDVLVSEYQECMPALILLELAKNVPAAFQLALRTVNDRQLLNSLYVSKIQSVAIQELYLYAFELEHDLRSADEVRMAMASTIMDRQTTLQFILDDLEQAFDKYNRKSDG